ncbi:hypothetical protein BO99DRAFT_56785 [Aspergillus violaceofuscus CBS 115571]|uniref:Uncharacterized protein n=1 Tax=Aspergillus violaceofuscus (strain CBS 115571) TaxID=1450538 RepID=A0A2V5GYK6_ASPV1|nr:hypothetical protein BO99DRAFT_56785 [Aspergillus violaceofuscus CBS 115571]
MPCPRLVGVSCRCSCMAASHLSLGLLSVSFSSSCLPTILESSVIHVARNYQAISDSSSGHTGPSNCPCTSNSTVTPPPLLCAIHRTAYAL